MGHVAFLSKENGDGLATFPFSLEGDGDGVATSCFYLNENGNGQATCPLYLKGKGNIVRGGPTFYLNGKGEL